MVQAKVQRTEFGLRVRDAMREKGWNQKVLAERAGMHYQQLHKVLTGERADPRLSTVKRLARVLGMSIDELAGPEDTP